MIALMRVDDRSRRRSSRGVSAACGSLGGTAFNLTPGTRGCDFSDRAEVNELMTAARTVEHERLAAHAFARVEQPPVLIPLADPDRDRPLLGVDRVAEIELGEGGQLGRFARSLLDDARDTTAL